MEKEKPNKLKRLDALLDVEKQRKLRQRRKFGIIGGMVFVAGISIGTAATFLGRGQDFNIDENTALAVINQAGITLESTPSPIEKNVLEKYYFEPLKSYIEDGNLALRQTEIRLQKTGDFLNNSENPVFRKYGKFLTDNYDTHLRFQIYPQLDSPYSVMTTTPLVLDNEVKYYIKVSSDNLLYGADTMYAALVLVHELAHVESGLERQSQLPPNSDGAVLAQSEIYILTSPDLLAIEEAKGYGVQSLGLIYEFDLGFNKEIQESFVKDAAVFVKTGGSIFSPAWISYIKKSYVDKLFEK